MTSSVAAPLLAHRSTAVRSTAVRTTANAGRNKPIRPERCSLHHHAADSPRRVDPPRQFWKRWPKRGKCCSDAAISPLRSPFQFSDVAGRLARSIAVAIAAALVLSVPGTYGAAFGSAQTGLAAYPCEDVERYYDGLEGLEGEALMRRLSAIVAPHLALTYKEVWDALKTLDAADPDDPENSSDVVEIYSLRSVPKTLAGKPEGWNREHLWPRSYGLIDKPSLTDLHNLHPADVNVNSSRGNKYYGECESESAACLRPANIEAAADTETDSRRWAPPYQVRGDVARSLMYMAVSYGVYQPGEGPHLMLSDTPNIKNREMGLLSTLLKWNEVDPPSKAEKLRNERVCKLYQHNRNPFIDHPEYVNLIWNQRTQMGSSKTYQSLKTWINEFHYDNKGKDKNEFVEIMVNSSTDASKLVLVLYNGTTGKMYKSMNLGDRNAFVITESGSKFMIYTAYVTLQNGPRDGMALVSLENESQPKVIQFLSYEGILSAVDGHARGLESVDVNVQETEASAPNDSLGLTETPEGELMWTQFKGMATPGRPNIMQRL